MRTTQEGGSMFRRPDSHYILHALSTEVCVCVLGEVHCYILSHSEVTPGNQGPVPVSKYVGDKVELMCVCVCWGSGD